MSKQNSSLISHRISTPLRKVQAAHLDALLLGIQLARGRAPDEVFNLLANELRSAIGSVSGQIEKLPDTYGAFDGPDEHAIVSKIFLAPCGGVIFEDFKTCSSLRLSSYFRAGADERRTVNQRCLVDVPCIHLSQKFCIDLAKLLCDIAQQLALTKPDSQAA